MPVKYHLVCVHPFDGYAKGQLIDDPAEVEKLLGDRDHHFVRIPAPDPVKAAAAALSMPASPFVAG